MGSRSSLMMVVRPSFILTIYPIIFIGSDGHQFQMEDPLSSFNGDGESPMS
jgi:hypothetical protein